MSSAEVPAPQWWDAAPGVVVPIPAGDVTGRLAGRRVVIHDGPIRGDQIRPWLGDVRAVTEPFVPASRAPNAGEMIGLLAEADWYRQERERAEGSPQTVIVPFSQRLDRVWVEETIEVTGPAYAVHDPNVLPASRARAMVSDPASPPVRRPIPIQDLRRTTGARLAIVTPDGVRYDLRAIGEPYAQVAPLEVLLATSSGWDDMERPFSLTVIDACAEADWYRYQQTGEFGAPVWHLDTRVVWAL